MHLRLATLDEFASLVGSVNIPWRVSNHIALKDIQKKILALESNETKIELLFQLARLRGGISDLLEILQL